MDSDTIATITQRLSAACSGKHRLIYWQDETSAYSDILESLTVAGATVVDATGAELVTKRRVLCDEPHMRFIIYRAGEEPVPTEDFIYDLRLRCAHFSCSEEGIWAEECGVPMELASALADHSTFFRSRERVNNLARSSLPKMTLPDLEFAMVAASLGIREGTKRDIARAIARRLVIELAKGREEGFKSIVSAGLVDVLWRILCDELGYRVPDGLNASSQDLAFRLVEGTLGDLVDDKWQMIQAEAARVVGEIASNHRTSDTYDWLCTECGGMAFSLVPETSRSYEALATVEHVPQADQWMLMRFAKDAVNDHLERRIIEQVASRRTTIPCAMAYAHHYASLVALARLSESLKRYQMEVYAATTMSELLEGYASSWYEVDRRYRELHLHYGYVAQGRFGQTLAPAVDLFETKYDAFLSDCAVRWQDHLLDAGPWPNASLPSQTDFFRDHIARKVPEAKTGHRIGVIVSDALRYECAVDFTERLNSSKAKGIAGKTKTSIEARVGTIPSYTQLGMAALLPSGAMEIDPATANVTKDGESTAGTKARQALISKSTPGSLAWVSEELPNNLASAVNGAPVIFIYHDVIDNAGDKLATERRTFKVVEEALSEIEQLAARLFAAGCGTVLVTSDHGFIYQDRDLDQKDFADIEGLHLLKGADGVEFERTRRFIVSDVLPKSPLLIEYTSADLSLVGNHVVGVPRGVMRFRLSGSGTRYIHGGVSPQECVVPVVKIETVRGKSTAHSTEISVYPVGRQVITGPSILLDVYQEEPVGDYVLPTTVKVGAYAKDGRLLSSSETILELSNTSTNFDDRKLRVKVLLTDDVDTVDCAILRVSRQVGVSNAFVTIWEHDYEINRAFGMDF